MTMKIRGFSTDREFWRALKKAVDNKDEEYAASLVEHQMQTWQMMLERVVDHLTHNGNTTLH